MVFTLQIMILEYFYLDLFSWNLQAYSVWVHALSSSEDVLAVTFLTTVSSSELPSWPPVIPKILTLFLFNSPQSSLCQLCIYFEALSHLLLWGFLHLTWGSPVFSAAVTLLVRPSSELFILPTEFCHLLVVFPFLLSCPGWLTVHCIVSLSSLKS